MTQDSLDDDPSDDPMPDKEMHPRAPRIEKKRILDPRDPIRMAEEFTKTQIDPLIFYDGRWRAWKDDIYVPIPQVEIDALTYEYLDGSRRKGSNGATRYKPKSHDVREVRNALQANSYIPYSEGGGAFWLRNPGPDPHDLLPCRNGLLHIPTRELIAPTPDFYCLGKTTYNFDPNAPPPEAFLQFLDSLELPTDAVALMQETAGYLLQNRNPLHKIFLVLGPTRAGKGVFDRLLTQLKGVAHVTALRAPLDDRFDLEPAIGKSLAYVPDLRLSARTDTTQFVHKLLAISGNDIMTIPRKFAEPVIGRLPLNIVITSNETPTLTDRGSAIAGRMVPLVFKKSFRGMEDPRLEARIATELSGILNWALAGYDNIMQRQQFLLPQLSQDVVYQLEGQASPLPLFVRTCCELVPNAIVPKDEFRDAFETFRAFWDPPEISADRIGAELKACYPTIGVSRIRRGRHRVYCYTGIRLRKPQSDE